MTPTLGQIQERYYASKFPELKDSAARAAVAFKFVEGMCWVMRYYYEGATPSRASCPRAPHALTCP